MATELFRVEGRVIDRATRRGVRGLRVEAWDRDTRYHDLLGVEVTDRDGRFALAFDSEYFGDYAPDTLPDLYYRVLQAGTELANTRTDVKENAAPGTHQVTLEVGLPAAEAPRTNRLSAARAFEAGEAFRRSDVRGLVREVRARGSLLRTLAGEMVRAQLAEMELVPVRPPGNRTGDVYNQDVETAQTRLAARGVEVNEVRQYEPGGDVGGNLLGLATAALYGMGGSMQGERVDLYQENGIVRYVRVVDDDTDSGGETDGRTNLSPDGKTAVAENAEALAALRSEMEALRTACDDKDQRIALLRSEMGTLRTACDDQVQQIALLRSEMGTLRGTGGGEDQPITVLRSEMDALRAACDDKDQQIAVLRSDLETVRLACDDKDRQIAGLQAEVQSLRDGQEALAAEVARALEQLRGSSQG